VTAETENLILEQLRATRADIAQLGEDVGMLKQRLTAQEAQVAAVRTEMAGLHGDNAILRARVYAIERRRERLERRLELTSA